LNGCQKVSFKKYDIQFNKLAMWMTPHWLRKQGFLIILQACFQPIVLIHNAFLRYRKAKLYELYINFQVCYLEAFLNDRFDYSQRRIYIDDSQIQGTVYIYKRAELKPIFLYKRSEDNHVPLYTRGESIGDLLNDFIIWIPDDVVFQEAELRAMISSNLSGKRYKIELF
jgi:hypothetical protein